MQRLCEGRTSPDSAFLNNLEGFEALELNIPIIWEPTTWFKGTCAFP